MPHAGVSNACLLDQPFWATALPGAGSFCGVAVITLISFLDRDLYHPGLLAAWNSLYLLV